MGPCGEIGDDVQEPRHHVAVEEHLREQQRWLGKDEEKAGDEEERQVLQVIQLDSPDALDAVVGLELLRIGLGVQAVFLMSSGEPKPPFTCIMRMTVSQDMLTALKIISVAAMT
jgi:hypothetical protein